MGFKRVSGFGGLWAGNRLTKCERGGVCVQELGVLFRRPEDKDYSRVYMRVMLFT